MRALLWNIRGMGKKARGGQLKDFISRENIDIVGIQETIKQNFQDNELKDLSGGVPFLWNWLPASGHSGGILVGVKDDRLEIEGWSKGVFHVAVCLRDRLKNVRWRLVVVYGPANHSFSEDFIEELQTCCRDSVLPTVYGGDFNLIRDKADKSSSVGDQKLMDLFNNFIENNSLREIKRNGPKFTWTNKQITPIQSNIDRVLCSTDWEKVFPLCTLETLIRVGSDHRPMVLDDGEHLKRCRRTFKFERQWIRKDNFIPLVTEKWGAARAYNARKTYSLDRWQDKVGSLRRFLKGWGGNLKGDFKRRKEEVEIQIRNMDSIEQYEGLTDVQYQERYRLEEELESIITEEQIYWQQRGGEQWILHGDANTAYFHLIANGKKRKKKYHTFGRWR